MDFDLGKFAGSLNDGGDGVWYADGGEEISYPETGHADSMRLQSDSFWYGHRNEMIGATIERWGVVEPFFDIGGGTGIVARYLQDKGRVSVLVEPGIEGARIAAGSGLQHVICGTASAAQLRPGSIPSIGSFDVIEHIDDDLAFVRHLRTLLVPGGTLFATVPAYNWLWSGEDVHAGHYRRYSLGSFRRLLVQAGFTPRYMTYFFWPLPLPILLLRSLPSLLSKGGRRDREKVARQHGQGASAAGRLMRNMLAPEVEMAKRGRKIPFGSSILTVAVTAK